MGLESVFPDYKDWSEKEFEGLVYAKPTVMIAFAPRSGSTHLCEVLHAAGQSSKPNEIFNPRGPAQQQMEFLRARHFSDYLENLASGPDEMFIFKTSWQDAAPLAPFLRRLFPDLRVVYLLAGTTRHRRFLVLRPN
ncbi:MAG: hypothetical protein KGH75_04190 [Rhodospirillales bacterium]|nr:hypothetical protein [Rhodospirillales bacterium]